MTPTGPPRPRERPLCSLCRSGNIPSNSTSHRQFILLPYTPRRRSRLTLLTPLRSFALRDSLAPRDKDVTETGPTADAARSLAGLTALWPCIYSARSLLESFSRLPKDHLRTAPGLSFSCLLHFHSRFPDSSKISDTMSLLPTFAATFLWRVRPSTRLCRSASLLTFLRFSDSSRTYKVGSLPDS